MSHSCHWPGCTRNVPPKMWGCSNHWFTLPAVLRARIWRTYRPGQEVDKKPSAEYIEVAKEVQTWCLEYIAEHADRFRPGSVVPLEPDLFDDQK